MKKIVIALFAVVFSAATAFSVMATSPLMIFTDVAGGMLYFDSINYLKEEGIVIGYADGSFGYDKPINRAELLKIVVKTRLFSDLYNTVWTDLESLSYSEAKNEACFSDVPAGEWYTQDICYAKEKGWIKGYSDGTFKPAQDINFVEAVKIVLEIFDVEYSESEPWYKGLVEAASERNLIPLTITDFGQIISRAEMSDMVVRAVMSDTGVLDEFLGEKADYVVTYDTISEGVDLSKTYKKECIEDMYCEEYVDPMLANVMTIVSSAFEDNEYIPAKYSCDGDDVNPPLEISGVTEGAESLVLILDDPDAPGGTWTHWVMWNIDPATTEIAENSVPEGAVQGQNSWNENSYGGPCPPSGTHHYYFKLYALDTELDLETSATAADVESAMEGHSLDFAQLVRLYSYQE